jgi:hypothetical protein
LEELIMSNPSFGNKAGEPRPNLDSPDALPLDTAGNPGGRNTANTGGATSEPIGTGEAISEGDVAPLPLPDTLAEETVSEADLDEETENASTDEDADIPTGPTGVRGIPE